MCWCVRAGVSGSVIRVGRGCVECRCEARGGDRRAGGGCGVRILHSSAQLLPSLCASALLYCGDARSASPLCPHFPRSQRLSVDLGPQLCPFVPAPDGARARRAWGEERFYGAELSALAQPSTPDPRGGSLTRLSALSEPFCWPHTASAPQLAVSHTHTTAATCTRHLSPAVSAHPTPPIPLDGHADGPPERSISVCMKCPFFCIDMVVTHPRARCCAVRFVGVVDAWRRMSPRSAWRWPTGSGWIGRARS